MTAAMGRLTVRALGALLLVTGGLLPAAGATHTLIARGATWKYEDSGSDLGTAWREPSFDDSAWASGPAELGYGDGDEATVVSSGGKSSAKPITTYYRHTFHVNGAPEFTGLTVGIKRDDGAVVYLNGTEVMRTNMPAGPITASTRASSSSESDTYHKASFGPELLREGANVVAVEIHQSSPASSDISFDLEMTATSGVNLTRGPYLQQGGPDRVIVRWRTDVTTESVVRYGASPDALTSTVESLSPTGEHTVLLSGLEPDTRYYYSIGTRAEVLGGGDASTFFLTSPPAGTPKPTRIWVLGDSGTANKNARAVRDGYETYTGTRHTDLWLMLGDNAYPTGTDDQYQAAVFDMYPAMLKKSVLWPTLGNHDAVSSDSPTESGPYYTAFTLPKNGEVGGLASGTEAYYSFDYGNIHFVCLDSHDTDRTTDGLMLTWLENDLANTTQDWIIAFFHHPPYTKGSHNSDNPSDSGGRMRDMRENALPILEAAGVDLVLTGHSHSYERSFLIDGHYGTSDTFQPSMLKDGGDGRIGGDGPYKKIIQGGGGHAGAVYAVAGSSGKTSGGPLDHPVMFVSLNTLGSMVLDVDRNRLDARFIGTEGDVLDEFTLVKDTETSPPVAR